MKHIAFVLGAVAFGAVAWVAFNVFGATVEQVIISVAAFIGASKCSDGYKKLKKK